MELYTLGNLGQTTFVTKTGSGAALGVACRASWMQTAPTASRRNWSAIDAALSAATAAGTKFSLSVTAGIQTPEWVFDLGAQTFQFMVRGRLETIPVPWDAIYVNQFNQYIQELGRRYAGVVDHITATGINGLTQETLLPSDVNSLNQWEQIGYTNSLISSTWISLLAEWAAAFPNTPIASDHGRGFMPNLSGNPDCTLDLIDTAEKLYPASYILQNNGLSGNGRRLWSEVKAFELDYPNGLIGFQFGAPQGANTQAALNVASANRGRYVEIYPADIMHV